MYEKEVLEAATNLQCKQKSRYYILTHKKHNREMYFKIGDKRALDFIKPKFNGLKKNVIYFLLRIGVLQLFLKKIMLPDEIGSLILVGGQIKGFNFDNEIVYSFPHSQWDDVKFVKDKENQIALGYYGFAPEIINLYKDIPYSTELMCEPYVGDADLITTRLKEFHTYMPGYIHGDIRKEQVVMKGDKILFVDWDLRKGDPSEDLNRVNMF